MEGDLPYDGDMLRMIYAISRLSQPMFCEVEVTFVDKHDPLADDHFHRVGHVGWRYTVEADNSNWTFSMTRPDHPPPAPESEVILHWIDFYFL